MTMNKRDWVPAAAENYVQKWADTYSAMESEALACTIENLALENRKIHEVECFNLNPATNVMNPRAEALLSSGMGSRPSLGYPGDKYEMGLEAIEKIEIAATELACEIFQAKYAEIRVASGALANLYAFMAITRPGDTIIVPPAEIAGHVTHHTDGPAGLYGLNIVMAPVQRSAYTVDVDALRTLALEQRPALITIGGSLNLVPHPVAEIRAIADEVGALVLFDAAHQCGRIAGKAWPCPLQQGAHIMTMSTYKSLGGPPSGLIVTNEARLAEKLDKIAFPGMTANFDAAKSGALAITLLDWREFGQDYASRMIDTARALARALQERGMPVFQPQEPTRSHQFALEAKRWGGGQAASKVLRQANFLACGIGLPIPAVDGDMNGLRFGTPELVRWGMTAEDMPELARLITRVLIDQENPEDVAGDVTSFRKTFNKLHYVL